METSSSAFGGMREVFYIERRIVMNETIALQLKHRSIRKFTNDPIPAEQKAAIIQAAQHAATSSNMQAYSIIGVTDSAMRQELAAFAGNQAYIMECPWFLVFCADLYRYETAVHLHTSAEVTGNVENFLVASVDAALAAQNAAIAAESLGLGIVYIGGLRNRPAEVSRLLQLPKLVYPVFGMCLGVPDQEPLPRPRLPQAAVYHENTYSVEGCKEGIAAYDEAIHAYMTERTQGKVDTTWSKEMAAKSLRPREHMKEFLRGQGFELQ
jgi:FMN reductase (NADPH)